MDGLGYEGSYFDENGQCIVNALKFAETMDAYVDICKNGRISGDSADNGPNEMVAESGANAVLYIMYNSSSEKSHKVNLGDGNYGITKALTDDKDRYFTSAIQPNIFSACDRSEGADYSDTVYLTKYLCSADIMNRVDELMVRAPTDTDRYKTNWLKAGHIM